MAEIQIIFICGTLVWIIVMALVAKPVGEMIERSQRASLPPSDARPFVLIASDDWQTRRALHFAVAQMGLHVEEVSSGERLLTMLQSSLVGGTPKLPDLIIADVCLAGHGPTYLGELIRALNCDAPIVLIAASADDDGVELASATILHKPFDIDDLLTVIRLSLR